MDYSHEYNDLPVTFFDNGEADEPELQDKDDRAEEAETTVDTPAGVPVLE